MSLRLKTPSLTCPAPCASSSQTAIRGSRSFLHFFFLFSFLYDCTTARHHDCTPRTPLPKRRFSTPLLCSFQFPERTHPREGTRRKFNPDGRSPPSPLTHHHPPSPLGKHPGQIFLLLRNLQTPPSSLPLLSALLQATASLHLERSSFFFWFVSASLRLPAPPASTRQLCFRGAVEDPISLTDLEFS